MSISSEITRLQGAKSTLKTKLNAKNDAQHQIDDETIDEYGDFVDSIQTGTTPTGTISITSNGTTDVTNYATASVTVTPNLQSKSQTISQNGQTTISYDSGYDGLSSVTVTTSVPQPSGTINITENGTVDVTNYASANVTVSGGSSDYNIKTVAIGGATKLIEAIETISDVDFTGTLNAANFFQNFSKLETVEKLSNTGSITNMNYLFNNSRKLKNVPIFDTSSCRYWLESFVNCTLLTDDSLNNILYMCAHVASNFSSSNKKLSYLGLTQTQATTCTLLTNWSIAQAAGWSTGY